ncbi:TPA: M15 family metallopeptidase [Neisseria polysaccharea]
MEFFGDGSSQTAGSFNYRVISGTNRRSAHAFGVAIDFSLPKNLGTYWKWAGCKEGKSCSYPQALRRDATLKKMVSVFEKYGFIWGGKWYHYDSVHFEYRPELLIQKCRSF